MIVAYFAIYHEEAFYLALDREQYSKSKSTNTAGKHLRYMCGLNFFYSQFSEAIYKDPRSTEIAGK